MHEEQAQIRNNRDISKLDSPDALEETLQACLAGFGLSCRTGSAVEGEIREPVVGEGATGTRKTGSAESGSAETMKEEGRLLVFNLFALEVGKHNRA